jgi:hypothetical protein
MCKVCARAFLPPLLQFARVCVRPQSDALAEALAIARATEAELRVQLTTAHTEVSPQESNPTHHI